MTSQKFSANNHSIRSDFKRSMKRALFPFAVSLALAVFYFILSPIYMMRLVGIDSFGKFDYDTLSAAYNALLCYSYYGAYEAIAIFAVIAGVFFAFWLYLPMMKKNSVNFYFSAPISRKDYFKNRTLAAVIMMALSVIPVLIIDVIINIRCFGNANFMIKEGLALFVVHFTYMAVGFSFMSVAMASCYTVSESLFFGSGILWLPTVLYCTFSSLVSLFLIGFQSTYLSGSRWLSVIVNTAHFNPLFFDMSREENNIRNTYSLAQLSTAERYTLPSAESMIATAAWLAISALLILIAGKIIAKRKLEHTALHGKNSVVTILYAVEISLFFTQIATKIKSLNSDSAKGGAGEIILAFAVSLVTYFIIISISRRKIKHTKKYVIPAVCTSAAVAVIAVICITGGFGYSTYSPDYDKIEYATITNMYTDASGTMSYSDNTDSTVLDTGIVTYEDSFMLGKFTKKENIDVIKDIQRKAATENAADGSEINIYYVLKNGKTIQRSYSSCDNSLQLEALKLTQSDEYKKELEFLLSSSQKNKPTSGNYNDDSLYSTYYFGYNTGEAATKETYAKGTVSLISNDLITQKSIKNTDGLRDALLKDLTAVDYAKLLTGNQNTVGALQFTYYADTDYVWCTFYLYPSMVNTLEYLQKSGESDVLSATCITDKTEVWAVGISQQKSKLEETGYSPSPLFISSAMWGKDSADYWYSDGVDFENLGKKITGAAAAQALCDNSSLYCVYKDDGYTLYFVTGNKIFTKYISAESFNKIV